jgi:hypothetical protein
MVKQAVVAALALALAAAGLEAADLQSHPELAQKATWKAPTAVEVRGLALAWLKDRHVEPAVVEQVEKLWADVVAAPVAPAQPPAAEKPVADDSAGEKPVDEKPPQEKPAAAKPVDPQAPPLEIPGEASRPLEARLSTDEVFDRLAATFAAADPEARALVDVCSHPRMVLVPPSFAFLKDEKTPPFERDNLRLLYGRWLAQERLYDEALLQLDGLQAETVVDPASLLFYQALVYQRMLKREPGLEAIGRLLEPDHVLPRRYASLARLVQADLAGLKDESLDHIARRMDDITRRLDLGRGGPKTREVEDGVIKSLDKLIEEIEKQQAASAGAMGMGQGSLRPISPAQDSVPMSGKGPGNVTPKNIGDSSGWGDLPAKQRDEALQQIGKDFPAHYRDMIEQYFRKLASENSEK